MYEWEPKKSKENKKKHGISFEEAVEFLFESFHYEVERVAYTKSGEFRHALAGQFQRKWYVAIYTIRDETIRIISVRRMRQNEEKNLPKD